MSDQEAPLRYLTKRMNNMSGMNYWQRLRMCNLQSTERRNQRYRVLYTWKSLNDLVPSLGLSTSNDQRKGRLIVIPKNTGTVQRIKTLKDKSIQRTGARLFNRLPRIIRDYEGEYQGFKELVDTFLDTIPDCPCLPGYQTHNLDNTGRQSNSIVDWCRNMKTDGWIPNATSNKG